MPTLKSYLSTLTKDQLVGHIMELQKNYPQVKAYYKYYLNPNEAEMLEKYKKIIVAEFFPVRGEPKLRFSIAKKAISEFKTFGPSPTAMADLMLTLPESAMQFTHDYGDMWEQYYNSTETNFKAALKFMHKEGLLQKFKNRIDKCVSLTSNIGWGLGDELYNIYFDYFES